MRELSLDRLRTLVAIADLGSFAAAARELHLAPPTVSLHISELEERIGAPLLLRQRSQVRPSGIGATLIARARQLLAAADQALEEVGRQVLGLAGRVRLGASTGAIATLLPQVLERLGQRHPDIDVQIHILTSQETLSQLNEGLLDIGLVALPQSPVSGLTVRPWRRDPVMAFLPAAWHAPRLVTPGWLAAQPLILNAPETRLSRLTSEWFAGAGEQPEARIQLNFNDAIKSLVAAGYGATLLPHEASAQGRPVPLDPRIVMRPLRPALWRPLGIAHRASQLEPATRHVLEALWELKQLKTPRSRA
ncbi:MULTISPECIES: LysR family transcriptional regulator [Herbaspirillum]|jgi:DNA-binding transcriptional LysR family regulator|uniref:LysR family transcriptional regulator n=2 Tax=Herbaspirillum huttiense TaxID=863372 RepID=A0AAJ2H9B3_9BURK|nr:MULTISPECIES: LysR family transcriptional regulator [Herbaspirillum]MCP3654131.1 LysR family transcriptional regulator [Herbaspirillum sp.]MCP3949204.1 LysR family transcriptional regulator [Herbaspirillum sp.]MCP4034690.1 LysR family transcriptional regulator [Herbaspirillum sp.]MCP4557054.1 LysR family transcriptional regulator [Herbaspirillum sp.]MDR9836457.1 LysR family transcriptional regulator [Herbaspirillum huttiense]